MVTQQFRNPPDIASFDERTMTTKIEDIPGIGKKLAQRLIDYYHDENIAFQAIRSFQLAQVPGISPKQACKFATLVYEFEEGISVEKILKTPDVREIYENILLILTKYTKTDYSKAKIPFYYPLPSSKIDQIKSRQKTCKKAIDFVKEYRESLENKNFSRILYHLDYLTPTEEKLRIKNRVVLSDHPFFIEKLKSENMKDLFAFEAISLEKIADTLKFFDQYCRTFDVVLYIGQNVSLIPDLPNLIGIAYDSCQLHEYYPEKMIQAYTDNRKKIDAMLKLSVILKSIKSCEYINERMSKIDLKQLKLLKDTLAKLTEQGQIAPGIDAEMDQFESIATRFHAIIGEAENIVNQMIQSEIGERSIRLEGKQILEFFRSDLTIENIRSYIPPEVDVLITEAIVKGIDYLKQELRLSRQDEGLLDNLQPEIIEYPIAFNEDGIRQLERKISSRINTHQLKYKVKIAELLTNLLPFVNSTIQSLLDFEFDYAIGQFAMDFDLRIPNLVQNTASHRGFMGNAINNFELQVNAKSTAKSIPIDYQVGELGPDGITKSKMTLLTGSNSGGKTMCIVSCMESLILAQMGFPTFGSVDFYPFDEIYYFKKSNGQVSAGAFETTLLQFVQLAQSDCLKVVFADELEAITEPNAAAKVMAGIFDLFLQNPQNYGVFVTHLVEFIQKELNANVREKIRIDGIEAAGLDEQLNLIIDRNPRFNFIAKSTPELILKKLAESGNATQKAFFNCVLTKFNENIKDV
jgi:hypothetical protein